METLFMRDLSLVQVSAESRQDPPLRAVDRNDPYEIEPPKPLEIFARLGVLLVIALAFGLVAELLVRLPSH
jgi:hypothetical protein